MIDKELLDLLCCPETRSPLEEADGALLARLNEAIASGHVKNRAGDVVQGTLSGGLIAKQARLLYPIVDDLPIMLLDEAIPLEQIEAQGDSGDSP